MGTASTMGILAEVLGFALPGSSTVPTGDERASAAAEGAGRRIVEMVRADARPSTVCGSASLRNALRVLNAIGGSTNAVIHLAALAGRSWTGLWRMSIASDAPYRCSPTWSRAGPPDAGFRRRRWRARADRRPRGVA